jgi:uncharacterized small protein (DUF1192 family)
MTNPDWENFAKAVLTDWPTGDLDGSVLFDLSLQYGMIQEVPGGFNSDHHIDADGICPEEGDPWYEYTFRGEAGPGLYSINDMTKRIEAQAAEIERLRGDLAKAGRDLNMARYGQPDFAWSIHKQAMADIEAKLENLLGGAETVLEAWDSGNEASFREAIEEMRADVAEAKGGKDE